MYKRQVQPSTRVPKYLDSYNYSKLFNEARINDGMNPYYTDTQLEGYRNSSGVNDVLYPNVDYYNEFLLNQNIYRKGTIEFNGGNEGVKYALVGGYTGGSGLEKVGERSALHRMNARGNLDIKITDFLTVTADVAARVELKNWGAKDGAGIFSTLSSNRPNEYPFIIPNETLSGQFTPNEDGTPFFGASTRIVDNLYADMVYGGDTSERYVNSQTNLGANFDFNKYVKGLTFNAYVTFDNYRDVYKRQGTISDIDGRFTLSVAANAVLKISYIGYQEKKIKVNDLKKEPIISLEEDSKQLEEVVVVGCLLYTSDQFHFLFRLFGF